MADNPIRPDAYGRETHSHLEGDARLLRYHEYRAASPDQLHE
jgi:hypothetical protein